MTNSKISHSRHAKVVADLVENLIDELNQLHAEIQANTGAGEMATVDFLAYMGIYLNFGRMIAELMEHMSMLEIDHEEFKEQHKRVRDKLVEQMNKLSVRRN